MPAGQGPASPLSRSHRRAPARQVGTRGSRRSNSYRGEIRLRGRKDKSVGVVQTEQIGVAKVLSVGSVYTQQIGHQLLVNVGDQLVFQVGPQDSGSTLVMKSDGSILLQGTEIYIVAAPRAGFSPGPSSKAMHRSTATDPAAGHDLEFRIRSPLTFEDGNRCMLTRPKFRRWAATVVVGFRRLACVDFCVGLSADCDFRASAHGAKLAGRPLSARMISLPALIVTLVSPYKAEALR